MDKKADIAINKTVAIILVLITLVWSLVVFGNVIGGPLGTVANYVREILGIKPAPFTEQEGATTATASVNALTYAINKIAWYDTALKNHREKGSEMPDEAIRDMSKTFEGTKAVPIYQQRETVDMSEAPGAKEAKREIVGRMIDCRKIYADKRDSVGCFALDFKNAVYLDAQKITGDDISKFAKGEYRSMCPDEDCKKAIDDLFGAGLDPSNVKYEFKNDGAISNGDDIRVCAENVNWLIIGRVSYTMHITDSDVVASKYCKPFSTTSDGSEYGMKVLNFNLPQEVTADYGSSMGASIVEFAENWVLGYGDPKYVVYYEVFPQGEEAYWLPQAYTVDFAQILTVEGIFLAIQMIPYVGKPIANALEKSPVGRIITQELEALSKSAAGASVEKFVKLAIEKAKNIANGVKSGFSSGMIELLEAMVEKPIDRIMVKIFGRELAGEAVEGVAEKIIKESATALPKGIKSAEMSKALAAEFKSSYNAWLDLGGEAMDKTGRLTPEFSDFVKFNFQKTIKSAAPDANNAVIEMISDKMAKDLSGKLWKSVKSPVARLIRAADSSNNKLVRLATKLGSPFKDPFMSDIEKEKFVRQMFDKTDYLEKLSPADVRRITTEADKAVDYALEMQELNPEFLQEILGTSAEETAKIAEDRQLAKEMLDKKFDETLKNTNMLGYKSGKVTAALGKFAKQKRHLVTAAIVYSDMLENSMGEKFIPVGTNAIGLRSPYMATVVYDDENMGTLIYPRDKKRYGDVFRYYGGYDSEGNVDEKYLMYQGLLPEVGRYYISLIKDKDTAFPQDSQRLHLVSPCHADLVVTKTKCECFGTPRESTIGRSSLPGLIAPVFEHDGIYQTGAPGALNPAGIGSFDGESQMLYTMGPNGVAVKECYPKGISGLDDLKDITEYWKEAIYKPSCIEINPIMREDKYNYCYHGSAPGWLRAADLGLNYGLPIGLSLLCAESGPGSAICGAIGGVVGTASYAAINTGHQWPSHN